jgi:hypothetical protein
VYTASRLSARLCVIITTASTTIAPHAALKSIYYLNTVIFSESYIAIQPASFNIDGIQA